MDRTIEQLLTTLNITPIRREKDTILVQLTNLKLVEIQIVGLNCYCVREVTRGNYSQPESEIGIENLTHYLQLLESSSWRSSQLGSPTQSELDRICHVWHIDDVFSLNKGLDRAQARSVLQLVAQTHNAEVGINWEVLSIVADIVLERGAVTQQ
jgi:hypothetical protein